MSSYLQSYPVFKSGAVLKHSDLNAIVSYLENQILLSRKYLNGFGIVDGMEVSCTPQGAKPTLAIGAGVAVMPNGQLVELAAPCGFKFIKPVDPDTDAGKAFAKCFKPGFVELTNDATGTPVSEDEKRCILLYVKNTETVSQKDLENCVRQSDINEQKKIEISFFLGEPLAHAIVANPVKCFAMPCLSLLLGEEWTGRNTPEALVRNIESAVKELDTAIKLTVECYSDIFCGNIPDSLDWVMKTINEHPNSIFYIFDYLKTVISAYHELIKTPYLSGAYSKAAQSKCTEIVSLGHCEDNCDCRQHWESTLDRSNYRKEAVFYAQRLMLLTQHDLVGFQVSRIRLTPSRSDMFLLSKRAVPFYFRINTLAPKWNYQLYLQRLSREIPHYGMNYCENHLCYTEGCDFIRVEGHIGMELTEAIQNIHDCRKRLNLPFEYIALEVGGNEIDGMPLWQPQFDDLERMFQLQRSYFLAAMDLFYNATPNLNKAFIASLVDKAENATCYQKFDYQIFISDIKGFIDSLFEDEVFTNAGTHSLVNIFDGLKIIDRSKNARLRQLFLDRFLHCHEGFEPMCGVPKGGTLAILYRRDIKVQDEEPVQEELESTKAIIPIRRKGTVVGDLAIPCCAVDLSKTPVAIFSVSIRFEYKPGVKNNNGEESQRAITGATVTLRNLSLHFETLDWLIETIDPATGTSVDDTAQWTLGECGSMTRVFEWSEFNGNFELTDFTATLTVSKDGKSDVYSEDFGVPTPTKSTGNGNESFSITRQAETPLATTRAIKTTAAKAVSPVSEDVQKSFAKLQRQRHSLYRTYTSSIEVDKIINDNKAFNLAKSFIFYPKSKAALHTQFGEVSTELIREITETKDAGRLEEYTRLLLLGTFLYLDKLVQDKEPLTDTIKELVNANRQYLAGRGITAQDFMDQWTTQETVSLPESNAAIQSVLECLNQQ